MGGKPLGGLCPQDRRMVSVGARRREGTPEILF